MNSYPQGYGPPASPATTRGYGPNGSPGPMDVFSANPGDNVGYVQAASPQPTSFPVAVNRVRIVPLINQSFVLKEYFFREL